MGKRLRVQRRGRGSSTFKSNAHKRVAPSRYTISNEKELTIAYVQELLHDPGRGSPLAKIKIENGTYFHSVAPEGIYVGQKVEIGSSAKLEIGNILPLGQISPGTLICNIENLPGDGGKLVKASGAYGSIISHASDRTLIKLPSKKLIKLHNLCRATIGVVSGAGRTTKPFLKAGKKEHWMSAKGHMYPKTKGVAMNAAFHPHGGGAHKTHSMKPTTVSRTSPPGQKVGLIAARQTGRKR